VSLPQKLVGGDLVRTANNDDYSTRADYLTLDLATASTVYVCYSADARDLPGWLKQAGWSRLDGQALVEVTDGRRAYNVFMRSAPKGPLILGGNERENTGAVNTYFVVVRSTAPSKP